MSTLALRMDTYSLAQLRLIRKSWAQIPHSDQINLVLRVHCAADSPATGPSLTLALPQNCSPAAVSRFASLAEHWQHVTNSGRSDLLDAILASVRVAKAAR